MRDRPGEPVHFHAHSADASAGVEVTVWMSGRAGTAGQRAIAADEFLEIDAISIISEPGGDIHAHMGATATPGAGETVERGTVAATGGIVREYNTPRVGIKGGKLWITAPNGVVDIQGVGRIRH